MRKTPVKLKAMDAEVCEALSDSKIFADLFNGSIFGGNQVISPESLSPCSEKQTVTLPKEGSHSQIMKRFRDIKKEGTLGEGHLAVILSVEGQRLVHYGMPVRNMLYDAMDYTKQIQVLNHQNKRIKNQKTSAEYLSGLSSTDRLKPVLTIVFYYGENWMGPVCLHDLLDFPEELLPWKAYFPNYPLNLVSSANVDCHRFKTGLREVFELLKVSGSEAELEHLLETKKDYYSSLAEERSDLISVFLDIPLLKEKKGFYKDKKGGVNVCTAIKEMVNHGEMRGKKLGLKKGEECYNQLLKKLLTEDRIEDIRRLTEDRDYRQQLYEEYNINKI